MFYIKKIKINNFRCFLSKKINLIPGTNVLIGENGCGKTSIAEAIGYVCLGKSFKGAKDKDVLLHNSAYFNIISEVDSGISTENVIISFDGKNKKVKIDENVCQTLSEYVGKYKLISFTPDDLDIIKGSPSERRRFIDMFISQCNNKYLKVVVEYKKYLKMRNEFLKTIENEEYDEIMYSVLTDKLIENAKKIVVFRKKYIEILNNAINKVSNALFNKGEVVLLEYKPDIDEEDVEKSIKNNKKLDILTKQTNRGPQKDDIKVLINQKEASLYASQGQIRLVVLCMKIGMYNIFKEINDNIIVILDDVFSELDQNKQTMLFEYIKNVGQVVITTTDIDKLPVNIVENSNIIEIKEGERGV
jgi:DNA replication and repair protein RecF